MQSEAFDVAAFARRFDHHAREYSDHLNEIFDHMRERCPVAHTDAYGGFWVLTRYEDVMRVVRDDETFSLRAGMSIPSNRNPGDPPTFLPGDLDPPESFKYRQILEPLVSPSALAALHPFVRQTARELVDGFIDKGEADLVQDLAVPLTAIVTLRLAGLPEADWPHYVAERYEANSDPLPPEEAMRRVMERFAWSRQAFLDARERQRENPVEGGLVARLIEARVDGRELTEAEYISMMINFVVGGLETTQALLGSSWVYLARNPDQREDLRQNPDLMPAAVEEMLRCFSPQPGLARVATRDTEVGGQPIREGEKVFMCWASANRDAAKFDDPYRFDMRRKPNRHLTFGTGAHLCLGRNLTRLEAQICMSEVLTRLPEYQAVEEGLERIPDSSTLYGYLSVPVTFTPGGKAG
ncbi:MAG: cytochrome P450 [Novosphingobium sp.]|nr:cytochrome P450 [Novosphingobium sp.]